LLTVASSADGNKLVAGCYGGSTYTSTNAGETWLPNSLPRAVLYHVATSADGNTLAAAAEGSAAEVHDFPIYTSTNAGLTWISNSVPPLGWISIVSSADGARLAAATLAAGVPSGGLYVSRTTPTPVLRITPGADKAQITWLIPSASFRLQETDDLSSTNWTEVTNPPVLNLTNLEQGLVVPRSATNLFYRLVGPP
jgi:hypothetical protein